MKILDKALIKEDLKLYSPAYRWGRVTEINEESVKIRFPKIANEVPDSCIDFPYDSLIDNNLEVIKYGFKKPLEANILLNKFLICLNSSNIEGMCVSIY